MMRRSAVFLAVWLSFAATKSWAFSVLTHQAVVDRAWEKSIVPALRKRFGRASDEELTRARTFAYGGSHVADLGYYPLGNELFTELLHYVRTGDFVASLVANAKTLDEYAFALGAFAHYVGDSTGHPLATNRAVAQIYPDLAEEYGPEVTYAQDSEAHLQTEFRFDVLQAARGYVPGLFDHALRFEIAKPVLEAAFQETYGFPLTDLFADVDVTILTYRWAFREIVHEATGIAWQLYENDIRKVAPRVVSGEFVYDLSRKDFERQFGDAFVEPGFFTKLLGIPASLVPNIGPLKRLPYKPLPAEVQQTFAKGFDEVIARYERELSRVRAKQPKMINVNLDTGRPTRGADYELADETYAELLLRLDERGFRDVSPELRSNILKFYGDRDAPFAGKDDDDWGDVVGALEKLEAETDSDAEPGRTLRAAPRAPL